MMTLMVRGVRVSISTQTISKFPYQPNFQVLANTAEIDYRMDEILKVKIKQIGLEYKVVRFQKMARITATEQEYAP